MDFLTRVWFEEVSGRQRGQGAKLTNVREGWRTRKMKRCTREYVFCIQERLSLKQVTA